MARGTDSTLAWHIIIRANDSRALAQTLEHRLFIGRSVLARSRGRGLLVFRCADTHLHIEVVCSSTKAGALAHDVAASLTLGLKIDVGCRSSIIPVQNQNHLRSLFDYILRQEPHHETSFDPFFEASNLPDLLGLRVGGAFTADVVRRFLPRVTRQDLLQHLKLRSLEPSITDTPPDVLTAALAAAGLTRLEGSRELSRRVRHSVVTVVGPGVSSSVLAPLLGVSTRTIKRLRAEPLREPLMLRAVRLQITLHRLLAGRVAQGVFAGGASSPPGGDLDCYR